MRRVPLLWLSLFAALSAVAADGPMETQARIMPPIGVAEPMQDPTESADPQARKINPPGGVASSVRIRPPGGAPGPASERSVFELFWLWLETQARIKPPIG